MKPITSLKALWLVAVVACALCAGVASSAQTAKPQQPVGAAAQPPRAGSMLWEWWNDAEIQKALALSPEKIKKIDDAYAARTAQTTALREEFVHAMTELDQVTRARVVDESTYAVKVAKVEFLRSELNKSRTVMLYRLFRELSPEQYRKLQEIRDQRDRNRSRDGSPTR